MERREVGYWTGGRAVSAWWRVIAALRRELWFRNHVCRVVGDGKQTYFWSNVWLGGVSLKDRFRRLFEVAVDKWVSVFDLCQLGWGENGEAWKWRRRLFAWEEDKVGELCLLLENVNLQVNKEDIWKWNLEKSNIFSVRSTYNLQTTQNNVDVHVDVKRLWQKDIPLKGKVFAWRLLRNRYQQKTTYFGVELSIMILVCVLLDVAL